MSEQARPGEARRSWGTVLLIFGTLFAVVGLFALASTGSPLVLVALAMIAIGLVLRFAR